MGCNKEPSDLTGTTWKVESIVENGTNTLPIELKNRGMQISFGFNGVCYGGATANAFKGVWKQSGKLSEITISARILTEALEHPMGHVFMDHINNTYKGSINRGKLRLYYAKTNYVQFKPL
ncbi:hypothetical protein FACS1894201_05360 [Bacteroidia bacterium]|nr:hypothetical protein FACS1894201_05360 [Bacteroidia bacterium]